MGRHVEIEGIWMWGSSEIIIEYRGPHFFPVATHEHVLLVHLIGKEKKRQNQEFMVVKNI